MTIVEMREHANRALKFFLEIMPDVPFGEGDVVFDFAPPPRMFARYKALCAEYRPREVILESHEEQFATDIGGQAIIGENKSAILICTKQPLLRANIRRIIFHELMHIYCAKVEVDEKHFVDIYGNGRPYDNDSEELCDGYYIWSEFIADYYSYTKTTSGGFDFESYRNVILESLDNVVFSGSDSRRDFEWACLNLLTLYDVESVVNCITEPGFIFAGESEYAEDTRFMLNESIQLLVKQLNTEKPWKINKNFISELGENYLLFEKCNTFYRLKTGETK